MILQYRSVLQFKMKLPSILIFLVGLLTSVTLAAITLSDQGPEIVTANGKLQGKMERSRNGRHFHSFYDIPYAKFVRRFAYAEAPENWEGVRSARKSKSVCPQAYPGVESYSVFGFEGDEDCLHLSVFVPKVDLSNALPVMIILHPGFFLFGQGNMLQPHFFMDEDIIVVTFNYRLGVLGFLSTEDAAAPGNVGLHDQISALKWVQSNIASFGGDPTKVTIFGASSGACSLHFLLMSPAASGLFTGAISQSGTALSPWAFQNHPKNVAMKFAEAVGCPVEPTKDLVDCLRTLPAEELVIEQLKRGSIIRFDYRFLPSVGFGGEIMPDLPEKLLEEGKLNKVPLIIGGIERDGLVASAVILDDEGVLEQFNVNWTMVAPRAFLYDEEAIEKLTPTQREAITSKIKQFYFGSLPVNRDTLDNLTHLYTDSWFLRGIEKSVKLHAKHGATVFPYMFSFKGDFSFLHLAGITEHNEPAHGDDLLYLFGTNIAPTPKKGSPEDLFARKYVKLLASFVQTGKPAATWGAEWHAFSPDESPVKWYTIDEITKYEAYPFEDRLNFWDHLNQIQ